MFFRKRYIEGLKAELREVKRQLREYTDTEFSPYEIYMMSERLAEFEEAGIEPKEVARLAEKAKEKELVLYRGTSIECCPTCEAIMCYSGDYLKDHPYCDRCGQKLKTPEVKEDECSRG